MLILFIDRGFDFTDESYYIAWTTDPARYAASIHPFGLPQHLLYELLGRSLIGLRAAGALALLASGTVLGWYLAEYYGGVVKTRRSEWMSSCALVALSYYAYWGSTPNYNLMADVSAAMVFAGSLGWTLSGRSPAHGVSSSLLIGIGGCLAFFAKPTSAGIMAVAVGVVVLMTWRRVGAGETARRVAIAALACLVPLIGVIASTVGLAAFFNSLGLGLSVLNFGNTIGTLPAKTLKDLYYSSPLIWITVTLFLCVAATRDVRNDGRPPALMRHLMRAVLFLNILVLVWNVAHGVHMAAGPWVQLGIACICLVLVQICYAMTKPLGPFFDTGMAAPVLLLCLLPFAIAFGSAISLLPQTGMSLFAPITASFIAAKLFNDRRTGHIVQAMIFIAVPSIILWSTFLPHNLSVPLYRQTEPVTLPFSGDTVRLDPDSKRYVDALRDVAVRGHLTADTPIVDLSGGGPGTMLVLGGRAPFYPWIFQSIGHPRPLVEATWASLTPEQKDNAWIIGPIDPAFADTEAVTDIRRRSSSYQLVGSPDMPVRRQHLHLRIWKPAATSAQGT